LYTILKYDTLSNLSARSDFNTGVAETFTYDNLNRLSLYAVLGGAVSPPLYYAKTPN
jgi:uncharacterized protein RhaS with RHS repeats